MPGVGACRSVAVAAGSVDISVLENKYERKMLKGAEIILHLANGGNTL